MIKVFRLNGEYFGFISNNNLFNSTSEYLGWIDDDGRVWNIDGHYIWEQVEENYILKNTSRMEPMSPMRPMNKMGKNGTNGLDRCS